VSRSAVRSEDRDLVARYLDFAELSGLSERTRYIRARTLTRLAAWLPVPLIEATADQFRAWHAQMPLCSESVRKCVTDASVFYAWTVTQGLRGDNPVTYRSRQPGEIPRDSDLTLIRAYLEYAEQSGLSGNTRYCRRRSLIRLSVWLPVPLIEATADQIRAWRAQMRLCSQSINNYVSDARVFYNWAVAEGLRGDNPADRVPVPRPGRRLPRPISDADLCAAIGSAPDRIRIWLILAAFCGFRCCEIALLRRESVFIDGPAPYILVAADATKGDRERIVPLAPLVVRKLCEAGLPVSGWMFTRRDGKAGPNTPHTVSALINQHLRACGIDSNAHALRHWFGTWTYAIENDPFAVAELMGHASLDSTRIYALVNPGKLSHIVAALPTMALDEQATPNPNQGTLW
jgi:integrase/recombinase XerC